MLGIFPQLPHWMTVTRRGDVLLTVPTIKNITTENITTENGAKSLATTNSAVLDLFFKLMRSTHVDIVNNLMEKAWEENALLTLKVVFHLRDCRGGKGERKKFHECIHWLVNNGHDDCVLKNLEHIPFYGTYKDLYLFAGTKLEADMLKYYAYILKNDLNNLNNNGTITLAAKWAPSEGGSVDKTHSLAKKLIKFLKPEVKNMKDYRTKVLVPLRTQLKIVESFMCSNNWDNINFQHVPSVAMKTYRKAFTTHQEQRFNQYLEDVKSGKSKINASMIFPHQLVEYYMKNDNYDETIELQWKAIVNDAKNKSSLNSFPLVDVSSSMNGLPMTVAIALGLLLSEISTFCPGSMLTFTTDPSVFKVDLSRSLQEKIRLIRSMPWGQSTNIIRAFDILLDTAKQEQMPSELMPKVLYIFSDMQFNLACPSNKLTNFEHIEKRYEESGYIRPNIVFWNLRGDTVDFPVESHVPKTALVSGFSQSLMELFVSGEDLNPMSIMMKAINSPRYSRIELC